MAGLSQRLRQRVRSNRPTAPAVCDHLQHAPADAAAKTPDGCGACIAQGTSWVDLRLCLTCGEVSCCDSSPWKHASAHFHDTQHPVVRSFERGENWRWCYEDEQLG